MNKLQVQVTNVYIRNAQSRARYLINIGGARSSKSHSIAQRLVQRFTNCPGRKILICRKTFPALRLTAYRLIVDLLYAYGLYGGVEHNKTEHVIVNPLNGAIIVFMAIDDPEKIKSTEWNDIWCEEGTEFTWEDFLILQTRLSARPHLNHPNQIFLSLNPSDEQSWINQRVILGPSFSGKIEIIRSSYRDNPFLDADYIALLEDLKNQDENAWRVYALGDWGVLQDLIYQPYEVLPEFPDKFDDGFYGLDFGFNAPTALLEIGVKDVKDHYLRQKLYQTHLTNADLIEKLKIIIPKENMGWPIYGDSEDPNRINEIHRAGFNIHPAEKGPDSVRAGIDLCKAQKFYTLAENVDLNKERGVYKWKQDKNGKILDEPVKFMDHLMDAKRYAIFTHYKGRVSRPTIRVFDNE
jgi:phage terminase large subunit